MRACRCVSERRSRASAEVIGQYQSQPRDNRFSCHASRGCVRECVRSYTELANASVRHSCKTNYFPRHRAYPVELRNFRERRRKGREGEGDTIGFAGDLSEGGGRFFAGETGTEALPGSSKFPTIRIADLTDYWRPRSGTVAFTLARPIVRPGSDKSPRRLAIRPAPHLALNASCRISNFIHPTEISYAFAARETDNYTIALKRRTAATRSKSLGSR